jgi:pimeloyl-ACP methyl ester carboxylesterase
LKSAALKTGVVHGSDDTAVLGNVTDAHARQDAAGALQRAAALFGVPVAAPQNDVLQLRRQFRDYIDAIPYDIRGNLREAHPRLCRALAREPDLNRHCFRVGVTEPGDAIHHHIFYRGSPQASRVVVSLTGTPITAGYLVPFFERVAHGLDDPDTAFLLLPSCSAFEAELVLYHLQRLNESIQRIDFFTHSGGSITLHQIQQDGYLPEQSASFTALGWVYRYDYETHDPNTLRRNRLKPPQLVKFPATTSDVHPNTVKRVICSVGQYYFPDFIWQHRPTRNHLISTFIDGTRLRRTMGGLMDLQLLKEQNFSYVRQVTALARRPGMQFLIFAGTDDDIVSEKHSRMALARLSGVAIRDIPSNKKWQNGAFAWHPIVGGKHLPMFEHTDEMVQAYVRFLREAGER